MQTITARMSAKYQVVIPKAVREALRLQPQDTLLFLLDGDVAVLRPRPVSFTEALRGLHQEIWPDPDGWLEEERTTWE
jgi:AbrB family looped-hinge helix DNA binding protein